MAKPFCTCRRRQAHFSCTWFHLLALFAAAHAVDGAWERTSAIKRSGDLGITYCSFQAKFGEEQALLHLWIRAFIQPSATWHVNNSTSNNSHVTWDTQSNSSATEGSDGIATGDSDFSATGFHSGETLMTGQPNTIGARSSATDTSATSDNETGSSATSNNATGSSATGSKGWDLLVKGFMFLEDGQVQEEWGPVRNAGPAQSQFSHIVSLRLYNSSTRYTLTVKKAGASSQDVIAVHGFFRIEDTDESPETWHFEVNVLGVKHVCFVVASLQPAPVANSSTADSSSLGHVQLPLGQPGQTVWLMSPFYGMPPEVFASLLYWHVLWHRKFGVGLHVVYIISGLAAILKTAQIQELLVQGSLQLVLWQDMAELPHLMHAHQIIMYNHGMLALHDPRLLVVITDLDEYLITPRPMSVTQVLSECPNRNNLTGSLGTLRISRWDAFAKEPAHCCTRAQLLELLSGTPAVHGGLSHCCSKGELWQWVGSSSSSMGRGAAGSRMGAGAASRMGTAAAAAAGQAVGITAGQLTATSSRQLAGASEQLRTVAPWRSVPSEPESDKDALLLASHPLANYFVEFNHRVLEREKSVYRPWRTLRVRVHKGDANKAVRHAMSFEANSSCVRFLHLPNLFKARYASPNESLVSMPEGWKDWLWPLAVASG